jgi:phosphatidylserine/phosphatidylglycerophosphate/cardiolipin synthase-like enzyme
MAGPTPPFTTCDSDAREIARLRKAELSLNPPVTVSPIHVKATEYWFRGLSRPTSIGNAVIAYDYGVCAFADIGDALATAQDSSHRIYLLGWWVVPDTRLKAGNGGLLRDYLANTKAEIRGMFWDAPGGNSVFGPQKKAADNDPIVSFLNGLPNGAAILDHKLPFFMLGGTQTTIRGGIHHQKLLVVSGSSGLIAFVGGMDINPTRVTSDGSFQPLHDVQLRIIGKESASLLRAFQDRWLDHPDSAQLDQKQFKKARTQVAADFALVARSKLDPDLPTATRSGSGKNDVNHAVTIGRTFAELPKFNNATNSEVYSFAPRGEESGWKIVQNAIQKARSFIYIEDQYFVSRRLKQELLRKLQDKNFEMLIVLMESSSSFENSSTFFDNEFPYLPAARNEIRTDFLAVDPKRTKWRLFSLQASSDPGRQQFCGSYVHSKTMIIDDDFAVIGSANADDRGYTYDTEVVVGVTDDPNGRASRQKFARNLRLNLWHKHLGVGQDLLFDWRKALKYWFRPPPKAMIVDSSAIENSVLLGPGAVLRNFKQADRLWSEDIDPDADKLP